VAGKSERKLVVLTSNTIEFPQVGSATLSDRTVLQLAKRSSNMPRAEIARKINTTYYQLKDSSAQMKQTNQKIAQLASKHNLLFLIKDEFLCDRGAQACLAITSNFRKAFYDYGHYTLDGAQEFGARAFALGWMNAIENSFRRTRQ
jgi:hypothetical protein